MITIKQTAQQYFSLLLLAITYLWFTHSLFMYPRIMAILYSTFEVQPHYLHTVFPLSITIYFSLVCTQAKSLQLCLTLFDPMDHSPVGSSVHGVLQARTLGGWPCLPPGDLPDPVAEAAALVSYVSCIGRQFLYHKSHLGRRLFSFDLSTLLTYLLLPS